MLDYTDINKAYLAMLGREVDKAGLYHILDIAGPQKLTYGRLLHILNQSEEFSLRDSSSKNISNEYLNSHSHPSESIHWFHSITLSDGFITNGMQSQSAPARSIFKYPVAGKSVLDIGAWDGYYSFEAESLGAREVLATDYYCWGGEGWGNKLGFDFAHRDRVSRVHSMEIDVFDITPTTVGVWDIVLFLGVLYHLTDPLVGLKKAAAVTRDQLVILTHASCNDLEAPLLEYREGFNGDDTTYWYPNLSFLRQALRKLGFVKIDVIKTEEGPEGVPIGSGFEKGITRYTIHAFR